MIEKTEAIVLRVFPFSETSDVVSWLTPDHGTVSTLVKGAHRPKSPFLGQYDLFYTCELLFYTRDRSGLHVIRECTPLCPRPALRTSWRAAASASYVCDAIRRFVHGGAPAPGFHALTGRVLDALCTTGTTPTLLFWFELQLVRELGLAPRLRMCASCGSSLARPSSWAFSSDKGGILCQQCRIRGGRHLTPLPPQAAGILRGCQDLSSPQAAARIKAPTNQLLVLRNLLGVFLTFHLEGLPPSRKIAMDLAFSASARSANRKLALVNNGAIP